MALESRRATSPAERPIRGTSEHSALNPAVAREVYTPKVCIGGTRSLASPLIWTMRLLMQDEHLVGEARERRKQRMDARERVVDSVSAGLFLAVAIAIAVFVPNERDTDLALVVCLVLGWAVVSRVRFEYGDIYTSAEELVSVPLFLLAPLNLVPLLAVLAAVLATLPDYVRGDWSRDR